MNTDLVEPPPRRAVVSLYSEQDGGVTAPLPAQTKSLVLVPDAGGGTMVGVLVATVDGASLHAADSNVQVVLRFWTDEGAQLATTGTSFCLWYAGRIVGEGLIVA